jgi:hypothetical protein
VFGRQGVLDRVHVHDRASNKLAQPADTDATKPARYVGTVGARSAACFWAARRAVTNWSRVAPAGGVAEVGGAEDTDVVGTFGVARSISAARRVACSVRAAAVSGAPTAVARAASERAALRRSSRTSGGGGGGGGVVHATAKGAVAAATSTPRLLSAVLPITCPDPARAALIASAACGAPETR